MLVEQLALGDSTQWILGCWHDKDISPPGVRFYIKVLSYQYRGPNVKDRMISQPSYL